MRPIISQILFLAILVSIHASVKDATKIDVVADRVINVSIHASVKDATYAYDVPDSDKNVSIHASVKDATGCCLC